MEIFDTNKKKIVVTDLEAAIKQAESFASIEPGSGPVQFMGETPIKAYWEDILKKLLNLRMRL